MKKFILPVLFVLMNCHGFSQGVDKPRYQIVTNRAGSYLGTINIELFPSIAPMHVNNFDSLVNIHFLDSTAFHRVVPGFVIQGGDPNTISGPISTWGMGQPWQQTVPAEFSVVQHLRGRIGAARDVDTNSANSQFYICVANALSLDGQYTVFGQVTDGMDVVDTIVSSPRDVNDVPLQKIEMFVSYTGINDTVPSTPQPVTPADSASDLLNGNVFQWTQVSDAVMYTMQISTDSLFTSVNAVRLAGTNSVTLLGAAPATSYYWRVKADNGGHESTWSDRRVFTTKGTVQLIYPANNATAVPINPTFQWTAMNNVNSYNLQIDTDSNFIAPYVVNINGITQTQRQVSNLPANTQLYWRVRYISGGVQGFFSEKYTFTTGSTTGVEELPGSSPLYIKNIYPVPATENLTIELVFRKPAVASLELINAEGQTVLHQDLNQGFGEQKAILKTADLAAGIYLLKISDGISDETRRVSLY